MFQYCFFSAENSEFDEFIYLSNKKIQIDTNFPEINLKFQKKFSHKLIAFKSSTKHDQKFSVFHVCGMITNRGRTVRSPPIGM